MKMKSVHSLEVSQTFCKMTHHFTTEDFAFMLYCNQAMSWIHLSCYSSCMVVGTGTAVVMVVVQVPTHLIFPRNFFFWTTKFPSMQVFVELPRFLTVCLFLKVLHTLMLLQVKKIFLLHFKEIHNNILLLCCKPKEHLNS